jgi:hypothetical protein
MDLRNFRLFLFRICPVYCPLFLVFYVVLFLLWAICLLIQYVNKQELDSIIITKYLILN